MTTEIQLVDLSKEWQEHQSVDLILIRDVEHVLLVVLVLEHVFGGVVIPKKVYVFKQIRHFN
jgi:hypothetical protein